MGCGQSKSKVADNLDNHFVNEDSLTTEEKAILKKTWPQIQEHTTTVGLEVFSRFFKDHPDYQQLFPEFRTINTNELSDSKPLLGHSRRIMKAIDTAVVSIDDFETYQVYLLDLGCRHRERNLKEIHLQHMRLAFVDTLQYRLASIWNQETSLAWNKLFYLVSQTMLRGLHGQEKSYGSQIDLLESY